MLLLAGVLFALTTSLPAAVAQDDGVAGQAWPQLGFDAARTGYNPSETRIGPGNVDDLQVAWTRGSSSTIRYGVVVVDGIAYYGTYGGGFYAVDKDTGATLWSRSLNGKHNGHAIVDGVAYVTGNYGGVYAFDATTGTTLWNWTNGGSGWGGPIVSDGIVLSISSSPDELYALDAATGSRIWSVTPRRRMAAADGVVHTAVVGSTTNSIEALDLATGNLLWASTTGLGEVISRPAVSGGLAYYHSENGSLYVFDADGCGGGDCAPLWTGLLAPDSAEGPQSPAVGDGRVYVGAQDTMHAFDATGCGQPACQPVWETKTSCTFFNGHSPSIANGVVYSACDNSYLYAFDASVGGVLWDFYTAGSGYPMRASPTIVDGMLYHCATFDFTLYAFELVQLQASATMRNGSGSNALCFPNLTPPRIGTSWDTAVLHGHHPGATLSVMLVYTDPASGPTIPAGELLVDLSSQRMLTHLVASTGTVDVHSLLIPNDLALVGVGGSAQAAILGGGGLELCNALDLVIGH